MQQQALPLTGIAPHRHRELSRRSSAGGRDGRARLEGARRRLRRRRSAATAGKPRHRRPRHRTVARGRQPLRRQGARGGAGRRRHRPRQLSRRRLRLRDPVADAAGDAAAEAWCWKTCCGSASRAIVSFPNFGFWKMRLQLLVGGHMPRTENLPATWYDTPNIHFCTIKDFVQLCDEINVKMERAVALDLYGRPLRLNLPWWFWNMFGEQGVFLLSRGGEGRSSLSSFRGAQARSRNPCCSAVTCDASHRSAMTVTPSPSTWDRAPASGRLRPAR